jgi:hypothetical protein
MILNALSLNNLYWPNTVFHSVDCSQQHARTSWKSVVNNLVSTLTIWPQDISKWHQHWHLATDSFS